MDTRSTENTPIVHASGVTKGFNGVTAVDNLTLDIPQGVIFGFIGPSGCGKTTSVRLMLGIYTPDEGEIEVFQRPPERFSREDQATIGYMPQQFVFYPDLTVWENLNFTASLYGVPLRRSRRLRTLLELVELAGHEHKKARLLSGGMQRRLSLAASMVHNPRLIFLDEPTAGIDPVLRRKFWDFFQQLKQDSCTLFVTTQYVGEAAYCDYVGVMVAGRLLMVETPEGLRRRALGGEMIHLHTKRILNETLYASLRTQPFVLDGRVDRLRHRGLELLVDDASVALPQVLAWCQTESIEVESVSEYVPVFDDVFVKLIEQETAVEEEAHA